MSRHWLVQRERGSRLALKAMTWIALRLGYGAGRLLLYPICGYFMLVTGAARRASRAYLRRVLGRSSSWRELFHHYHCFASTILDRVYLLSEDPPGRFDARVHGAELIRERRARGQGCILLGSHLGSFEVLRTLGVVHHDLPINVLMYQENSKKISAVFHALNPRAARRVINIGAPDSLLRARECIAQGELVGILGDRVVDGDKVVPCTFLGERAMFPAGPLLMASALGAPVILFFGLYRGAGRYDVHFELLAEKITISKQPEQRRRDLECWVQRYAARLEHYCRAAPFNWFNFYDYWNERERAAS